MLRYWLDNPQPPGRDEGNELAALRDAAFRFVRTALGLVVIYRIAKPAIVATVRYVARTTKPVVIASLTPLLEKNVLKTKGLNVPFCFSMSRLIVLAFAAGVLRQIWSAGIAGWPDATLAIAIVLAIPVLGALERANSAQVLDLFKTLLERVGEGDVRRVASVYAEGLASREPSKFDDHRDDGDGAAAGAAAGTAAGTDA
jgi:hypothetical protein